MRADEAAVVEGVGCVVAQLDRSQIEPTAAVRAERAVVRITESLGHICSLLRKFWLAMAKMPVQ
jgi:hypothetical protein